VKNALPRLTTEITEKTFCFCSVCSVSSVVGVKLTQDLRGNRLGATLIALVGGLSRLPKGAAT